MIWEYFVSELGGDAVAWKRRLEALGLAGWELVSTHEQREPWDNATGRGQGTRGVRDTPLKPNGQITLFAILKRPRDTVPSTVEKLLKDRA